MLLNRLHRPPDAMAGVCNLDLAEWRVVVGMDRDGQLLGARRGLNPVPVVHTAFGEPDIIGQDQHIAAGRLVKEAHVGQEVGLVRGQDHRSPLLNTHSNASASGYPACAPRRTGSAYSAFVDLGCGTGRITFS